MSRRSVPPIAPQDLRDHADDARIDRIWERLESDLSGTAVAAGKPRRSAMFAIALAATFAAFAGGVVVGKRMWSSGTSATAIHPAPDRVETDIFAAGEQGRTYDLPGVGQLRLKPGATVELDKAAGGVTLRLVQGEASVDKVGVNGVAIVAGEARLSSLPGSSVTMQKHDDDVDVRVDDGSADLASPNGTQHLQSGEGAQQVPIHSTTARVERSTEQKHRGRTNATPSRPGDPQPEVTPPGPAWQALYEAKKYAEAYDNLQHQGGGVDGAITGAQHPSELMQISDVASIAGDGSASIRALNRIVDSFRSDQNAQVAARQLAVRYQLSNPELAKKYAALYRSLSASGALSEDALCTQIRVEKHKDEATRLANEYIKKYPDGSRCKDDADRIIKGEESFDEGDAAIAPSPSGSASALAVPVVAPAASKVDPKP